ncbi:MAG: CusA/CzcA family heavy metal efflux RND transporter [Sulfurospirillaceae bacterium]|nr:CusA/CzcA family heavy metal efflux RND transporter [Sulfurospirillaceae bacterium]
MINAIIDASVKNKYIVLLLLTITAVMSYWAIKNTPLDALPDLTPPQVIVNVKYMGQSPKIIEDQIIYELSNSLLSVAKAKTVRAFTSFENAIVYIIFEDSTDMYWARDRVSEVITSVSKNIPKNATIKLGPDATGIGWVFEYALTSKTKSLEELRSIQDYLYRYALLGVSGISEVASVGGHVKNYEITLRNDALVKYDLSVEEVASAISKNNSDLGGRVILENGFEHIIQAKGFAKNLEEIASIGIQTINSIPLTLNDISDVRIVPSYRSGFAELNGEGEVVGGIVVVRHKENAYQVIQNVKEKLKSLHVSDVEVVTTYDRSDLITKAIDNLKRALFEESIVVLAVVMLFLLHFRSALVVIIVLPLTIALTFLCMKLFGLESNIMSLGGIAIAIGAMVDACIVMIENVHKKLLHEENLTPARRIEVIIASSKQVGRPIFFALILIVVSFLPIFALSGQEGALFKPLAFTKTFAMLIGAVLSITLVPILMLFFIKGGIIGEEKNPINRFFIWLYQPILKFCIRFRYFAIAIFLAQIGFGYYIFAQQKWEFMPPLNEQTFMYMPVTPFGISVDMAKEYTHKTNQIIKSFSEVESVFGKAGRAESATDPAPLSMIETIIQFKPKEQWREGVSYESLMDEMEEKLQVTGLVNSWTYPIRGRIDMLMTGIRTPVGIKLYGDNDKELEEYANKIEQILQNHPGTKTVFADKANSGYFLNINLNAQEMATYGLAKEEVLNFIDMAIGGGKVGTFFKGIERYPISLRLEESDRKDINALAELPIKTMYGFQPLKNFATLSYDVGATELKSEMGKKVNFLYITLKEGYSSKTYKEEGNKLLSDLQLPIGFYIDWAGESEYLESAMERLTYIMPLTLLLTFVLIYLGLGSMRNAVIIFLTLPFAAVGGILYVNYLGFHLSIAVVVGFLALIGIAVETAIVMIIYLEEALLHVKVRNKENIKNAIFEGAVMRVRPKLMTVFAILGGLLPIMYLNGVGSEVMQRIAAPMIGGVVSSAVLTLLIIPVIYYMVQKKEEE